MSDGLILLLLFAVLAVWFLGRIARMLRISVTPKRYATAAVIVVLGLLTLYAGSQQ